MKKRRAKSVVTKKHMARAKRERIQRNWIIAGAIITALTIVGILGYGLVYTQIIKPQQPVVTVDGQEISNREFQGRIRLALSPESDPLTVSYQVLNELIDDLIIRQEANRLGITITTADVDRAIQQSFGYFPDGTPTSVPTSTPDPTGMAETTATSTVNPSPTVGSTSTSTSTSTPRPTATVYTHEAFEENYHNFLEVLADQYESTETDYRTLLEAQLYRERLIENFEDMVAREQEQVLLRHIQVEEREVADDILTRLDDGEAWEDLVAESSEDILTKDTGGDLGWLPLMTIVERYDLTASLVFEVPIGDIVGPIETQQGWHLFEVVDRGERSLDEYSYYQAVQNEFISWLNAQRESSDIVFVEN